MEIFLIILSVILVVIIVLFLIIDDLVILVWYLFTPKLIRYKCLKRFKKSDQKITILGTLHGMHLTNDKLKKYYTFQDIKAVLINLKPDLVLVESLQTEIEQGNIGDGPPEMLYVHLNAKALGIPVKGIDWISYEGKPRSSNNKRDEMMLENIMQNINGYQNVLVVFGAAHLLVEKKKIKKYGYKNNPLTKSQKNELFYHQEEKLIFPSGTLHFIDKRIEREKEILKTMPMDEIWQQAIKRLITGLEKFKTIINEESSI